MLIQEEKNLLFAFAYAFIAQQHEVVSGKIPGHLLNSAFETSFE